MMSLQYGIHAKEGQTGEAMSQTCAQELETYLTPWSERLDAYVDRRIVGNLIATVAGIVQTRSDLTRELNWAARSRAHSRPRRARNDWNGLGTHQGWKAEMLEQVWWEQAESFRQEVEQRGETRAQHLGQQCAGKGGESEAGRLGQGAFE